MPDDAPPRLRFPRAMRLQQTREFARMRERGRRSVKGCLIANWTCLPRDQRSKLGVVTSRKIGSAVVRSRARRLMREAFRQHQHDLASPLALVLVARPSIGNRAFSDVERDFLSLMRQAGLLRPTH